MFDGDRIRDIGKHAEFVYNIRHDMSRMSRTSAVVASTKTMYFNRMTTMFVGTFGHCPRLICE